MTPAATPRILIVDDNDDIRDLYRYYLERVGIQAAVAASAEEAIEQVHHSRPSLIVMDLMMPGIGGLEGVRRLKGAHETNRIPVIALTAHPAAETEAAALEACCDAFIRKPCLPEDLLHEIRKVLAASRDE